MGTRKISICIPTYKRFDLTIQSIMSVIDMEEIGEIVIVDDASNDGSFEKLRDYYANNSKVKVFKNEFNLDCYFNKHRAVELATNEWVIILDSDNKIGKDYIDRLYLIEPSWHPYLIYQPSFAMPHFNFTNYEGVILTQQNIREYIDKPMVETCLNAMNYFVNRESYLDVWDGTVDPVTSDSIFHNYNWLNSGRSIYIVPGLQYSHNVHSGSHYQNNNHRTEKGFHEAIKEKIRQLN